MSDKDVKEFKQYANEMIRQVSNIERALDYLVCEQERMKGGDVPQMLGYFKDFLLGVNLHASYLFNIKRMEMAIEQEKMPLIHKKTDELNSRILEFSERHETNATKLHEEYERLMADKTYSEELNRRLSEEALKAFKSRHLDYDSDFDELVDMLTKDIPYIYPSQETIAFYIHRYVENFLRAREIKRIMNNPSLLKDEKDIEGVSIQIPLTEFLKMTGASEEEQKNE